MTNSKLLRLLALGYILGCFCGLPSQANAQEAFWHDGKWAHEHSDLQPDPKLTFARLDNGFRYVLIPNENPPGRVSLYLNVQTGGLMEEDYEHGYAHLIEHMAFNGTRNFPSGSLIPFFQQHGMSFGGDTNAHTSYDETVYKLNLADNKLDSVAAGMLVLRDIADGILFEPDQLIEEIQVVLAEKAARDSEGNQSRSQRMLEMYPNSLFSRPLIGSTNSISSATPDGLRGFYDKWYRPERMFLAICGSISPEDAQTLVVEYFADLRARAPQPTVPDWGETHITGKRFMLQPRPVTAAELGIYFHHPREYRHDSSLVQQQSIMDTVATYCFRQRLSQREQIDPGVWRGARFVNNWRATLMPVVSLNATTGTEGWQRALTAIAEEIRDVLAFGFQEEEINAAIEYYNQVFTVRALQQLTLNNGDRAQEFINIANLDRVYTSVWEDMNRFEAIKPLITAQSVHQALQAALALDNLTVYLSGNLNTDQAEIQAVWEAAINAPPMEFVPSQIRDFPYLPLPAPIEQPPALTSRPLVPVAEQSEQSPQLHSVVLANGVELYFMPLSFESGLVKVELLFGPGFEQLSDDEIVLARLAGPVLREGGLGDFNRLETRNLFTSLGGRVQESHSVLSADITGSAASNKVSTLLLAIWTQFVDPKPTQAALNQVVLGLDLQRHRRFETVSGVDRAEGYAFFNGEGQRFRPVEADLAHTVTLEELTSFILSARQIGPIRLLISGDFDLDEALSTSAWLFSSLDAQRRSLDSLTHNLAFTPQFPSGQAVRLQVPDSLDKAVIRIAWHCDLDDLANRRLLATRQLAAQILADHVREQVRERMGATYSPEVNYTMSAVDQGYGFMTIEVQTENAFVEPVRELIGNLQYLDIDEPTLERLRGPMRTSYLGQNQRNELWHRVLNNEVLTGRPYALWHNGYLDLLDSISADEVSRELRSIFSNDKAEWVIVSSGRETAQNTQLDVAESGS